MKLNLEPRHFEKVGLTKGGGAKHFGMVWLSFLLNGVEMGLGTNPWFVVLKANFCTFYAKHNDILIILIFPRIHFFH